jgi:hypothetical protein
MSCLFKGNSSKKDGGGICLRNDTPALIENCEIVNNSAPIGAAIAVWNDDGYFATIRSCLIRNNTCTSGGGIYLTSTSTKIYNCTIVNNQASPAIYFDCTTSRTPTLENSILWGNMPVQIGYSYPVSRIYYNDIRNGWTGTGNINVNPDFVNSDVNDYHLHWESPCRNNGDPGYIVGENEVDIDGEPRIMGGRIDMGFDEVGEKQADLNHDGVIDFEDVEKFVQAWLSNPGDSNWCVLCDLYRDNQIDFRDWTELAKDWLWQAN